MKKLHELLSIEPDLRKEAEKISAEVRDTLSDPKRVSGMVRTYRPTMDGEETEPKERVEMVTTVSAELDRFNTATSRFIDSAVSKETTNMEASAELKLEGGEVYRLPATALLNLENRLGEIRKVYASVPTLDPSEIWHYDKDLEVNVSEVRMTFKTKKVPKTHIAHAPTKEHPAQVQVFHEDIRVGERETILHSGAITLARKRLLLGRIDKIARAVKQARQRANDIEVDEVEIGERLFEVINA